MIQGRLREPVHTLTQILPWRKYPFSGLGLPAKIRGSMRR